MKLNRFAFTLATASFLTGVYGCGPKFSADPTVNEYAASDPGGKIRVEAYLYDAKIRRDGKPTSLRLELYQTDSLVGLSARGYLGKGVLKGRLTADSLEAYFPAGDEYLYESIQDLLKGGACNYEIGNIDFPELLKTLPDRLDLGATQIARAETENNSDKQPEFVITWPDCRWRLEVSYRLRNNSYRLYTLFFDNGDKITFTARLRAYRPSAKISREKFEPATGPETVRITP